MNKVSRVKNENFTVISNVFLKDKNLSIKAKGFLAVVMGLPNEWEFSINGVCSILKEGKTAIYNVIDELKENGYCSAVLCRDDKGRIAGNDYTFYEEPQMEQPHTEIPNTDNQPQLNTNSINDVFDKRLKEKEDNKLSSQKKEPTWRDDFGLFLVEVDKAKTMLLADKVFKEKQERYYPNLNYELTLQKMVDEYWGTEEAWNKRKKQKKNSEGIDMLATLKKAFSQSCNRVYKSKTYGQQQTFSTYTPQNISDSAKNYLQTLKVGVKFEHEGVQYLVDGTFIEGDKRYYRDNRGNKVEVPIGLEERPNESYEYSRNMVSWVQDERKKTCEDMLF